MFYDTSVTVIFVGFEEGSFYYTLVLSRRYLGGVRQKKFWVLLELGSC